LNYSLAVATVAGDHSDSLQSRTQQEVGNNTSSDDPRFRQQRAAENKHIIADSFSGRLQDSDKYSGEIDSNIEKAL
jgi:hypothetical protein